MSNRRRITHELLSGVVATGAGSKFSAPAERVTVQVEGITTATVKLEGSNDGTNWVELRASTADEAYTTSDAFAWLRGNVTAWTSGTITMTLGYVSNG